MVHPLVFQRSVHNHRAMQRSYDTGGLENIDSYSCPLVVILPTPTGRGVLCCVCMGGVGRYPGSESGPSPCVVLLKCHWLIGNVTDGPSTTTRGRGVAATGMSQLAAFTPGCQHRKQGTTHTHHWCSNQSYLSTFSHNPFSWGFIQMHEQ